MGKIPLTLVEDTEIGKRRAERLLGANFDITDDRFLGYFEKDLAEGRTPRVVVTNLMLSEGPEEGLSLIRHIRELCPGIIIVVWTKLSVKYHDIAVQAGANLAYAKYYNDENMGEEILRLLQ